VVIYKAFLSAAILFLTLSYGIIAGMLQLFPAETYKQAVLAGAELWSDARLKMKTGTRSHPHISIVKQAISEPLTVNDSTRAYGGYTLVEFFRRGAFGIGLIDSQGSLVHEWRVPQEVYAEVAKSQRALHPGHYEIMGSHLYPDGSVIFTLTNYGLVKLDRCSSLLWYRPIRAHHDVTLADDGTIWTLNFRIASEASGVPPRMRIPMERNTVVQLSPQGEVLKEFDILDGLLRAGYHGLVLDGPAGHPRSNVVDPVHANDIEIVDHGFAAQHPFADPGDLLLSLRTIDSLVLFDPRAEQAKWVMTGPFLRQHDPDLLPDGSISVFDNRTAKAQHNEAVHLTARQLFGFSRIIRIDPASQRIVWEYSGTEEAPFYTSVQGDHQTLPNGNVLAVETEAGRLFEIDPADNRIVWEWFNLLETRERESLTGRITRARRIGPDYPEFVGRACAPGAADS